MNNDAHYRNVLYTPEPISCPLTAAFFANDNVDLVKNIIQNRLCKYFKKTILVPREQVLNIMNEVFHNRGSNNIGDIYSRYIIQLDSMNYLDLNNKVIDIIVNTVQTTIEMEVNNNNLSIWTTIYGDNNDKGLRSHSKIKINERRPSNNLIHMKY